MCIPMNAHGRDPTAEVFVFQDLNTGICYEGTEAHMDGCIYMGGDPVCVPPDEEQGCQGIQQAPDLWLERL